MTSSLVSLTVALRELRAAEQWREEALCEAQRACEAAYNAYVKVKLAEEVVLDFEGTK